jgi:steroid delta-isomerase-like uncharacterized protein
MSSADVARRYFEAVSAHDLDAVVAMWAAGGIERMGQTEMLAPEGPRDFLRELYGAFPDLVWDIRDVIGSDETGRVAVRWRMTGTFAGPGSFQGFVANGAHVDLEGCDILEITEGGKLQRLDAYFDASEVARQLGVLPPTGSRAEANLTRLANARTRALSWIRGSGAEPIADGVWLVRGGIPRTMNVFLIEEDGGVTLYDAGISEMTSALASAGARLGGIKRVVLGHADADHRGAAPGLDAPVYCHPGERAAAESADSYRDYWDRSKLDPHGRALLWRLIPTWDGGAVQIAGTLEDGEPVGAFRVVHLPGHAPGQIALFRESDRLALVSDVLYTLDPQTGRRQPAHVPHPAFNQDTEQARDSIRRLAALDPATVWAGHSEPVTGDVRTQLERAATAPA